MPHETCETKVPKQKSWWLHISTVTSTSYIKQGNCNNSTKEASTNKRLKKLNSKMSLYISIKNKIKK